MSQGPNSPWIVFEGLRTLIFPEVCIMCERTNALICDSCLNIWESQAQKLVFNATPTFSVVPYDQQVSSVVLKAKEERNKTAQFLIARAISVSLEALMGSRDTHGCSLENALLVPIPSSRQAIRKRGESFLHPIMSQVIELTRKNPRISKVNWSWSDPLTHRKRVQDQAGLTSSQRAENLSGAFSVLYDPKCPVILVDDVVTTGATLKNAVNAFEERKMTVLGAVTACASAHQLLIR